MVAIDLNNLAQLLKATNRLAEAEPLMRRMVEIFLNSTRATGHPHPHLQDAVNNYAGLLMEMGRSREQVLATLREMAPELFRDAEPGQEGAEGESRTLDMDNLDDLRALNNASYGMRQQGQAEQCEPIDRIVAEATEKKLGATHPLTLHRRNNLVLDLLLLGRAAEARALLDQNWKAGAEQFANLTPRIPFLAYLSARVEGQPADLFLGQVKTLVTGPELPTSPDIGVPWDLGYFFEQLRERLPNGAPEILTALVAAQNDRANLPALDSFQEWVDQPPIPLDVTWPSD
jgi:hypothetical protein